jgi:molecular chaperone GrpE
MSEDQTAKRADMSAGAGAEIDDQGPETPVSGAGLEDHTDFQQVREDLVRAEARAEENRDQYLRIAAELDNLRKRSAREVERARLYGLEAFAKELLAVVDSVELGLVAAEQAGVESLTEGSRATLKLALDMLQKFNISVVDPLGEPFDPQVHEAMAVVPDANAAPDSVVQVVQKGYLLHDRLLRPARVMVAKGE